MADYATPDDLMDRLQQDYLRVKLYSITGTPVADDVMTGDSTGATATVLSYDSTNKYVDVVWESGTFDQREAVTFVGSSATAKIRRSEIRLIQDAIDAAEDLIDNYCNREFGDATLTDTHEEQGYDGQERVYLPEGPIVSVTSFTFNGTALTEDEDFWLTEKGKRNDYIDVKSSQIVSLSMKMINQGDEPDDLVVNYVYGVTNVPDAIRQATVEMVVSVFEDMRRHQNLGGATEMGMADFRVKFEVRKMSVEPVKGLLNVHRRRRIMRSV